MAWPNQSNNNNTNSNDENTSSWEEQQNSKNGTEREMIYETFYSLAKTRLMEETQNTNGGLIKESPAYKEEVKHLNSILTSGVTQGLAGGLFVFASLRAAPYLLHRIRNRVHKPKTPKPKSFSNSSYQFDSATSSSSSSFSSIPKPPIFLRIIRLGLDITASAFFASAISELCADTDQMVKAAADIPLVAGRSAVSDVLCEDFVKVYTSIPKQTWDNYKGTSVEWDSLGTFCQNCIRRQTLEKDLRQQTSSFHGSFQEEEDGVDRHVEIPMPGVPKDLPIYIPWGDGSDAITVGKERQEDDFMGPSFDFVEDDEGNFTTEFDTFDSHSGDKDEKRKRP